MLSGPVDPIEQHLILTRILLEPHPACVSFLGGIVLRFGLLGRFPGWLAQNEAVGRARRG